MLQENIPVPEDDSVMSRVIECDCGHEMQVVFVTNPDVLFATQTRGCECGRLYVVQIDFINEQATVHFEETNVPIIPELTYLERSKLGTFVQGVEEKIAQDETLSWVDFS